MNNITNITDITNITPSAIDTMIRELDHRRGDGFEVTLLWNERTNRLFILALDERDGTSIQFEVRPADAVEAFHHPYAYAAHQPVVSALAA